MRWPPRDQRTPRKYTAHSLENETEPILARAITAIASVGIVAGVLDEFCVAGREQNGTEV